MPEENKGIIPYGKADAEFQAEIAEVRKEKFRAALKAIVTGKTPTDEFPNKELPTRPIRGGKTEVDYIPGWWMLNQLNALFSHNWDFQIVDKGIDTKEDQVWVLGRLTVRDEAGNSVIKEQFGGSDIKRYSEKHPKHPNGIMDLADDLKAASTDSLKKCSTELGFGSDVYGNRELLEKTAAPKSQIRVLYKRAEEAGMGVSDVEELCAYEFEGAKPEELVEIKMLDLLDKLNKIIKEKAKAGA